MSKSPNLETTGPRGLKKRRWADLFVGAPLVWLIGLFHRKRHLPDNINTVVLLQTAAIGDTLLMAAGIRRLRSRLPGAKVILILGRDNKVAAQLLPPVDQSLSVNVLHPWTTLKIIRSLRADVFVDYGTWPRINALLTALSGSAYTAGFRTSGQSRHFAYDFVADHSNARHELSNQGGLLDFLGGTDIFSSALELPPGGLPCQLPAGGFVVFHAWACGTGYRLKEWPADRWGELARWVHAQNLALILTGGPGDVSDSEALAAVIRQTAPGIALIMLAGRGSLLETARLLKQATAVVSVNTGIMHLAALLDVPTVGLHGPTNPLRWGPAGGKVAAVISDCAACGYLNLGFEFPGQPPPCMERLEAAPVIRVLDAWLGH